MDPGVGSRRRCADLIQDLPEENRSDVLSLLDATTHFEVSALLAYKEDVAGGLMSPRYARIRSDMTVHESGLSTPSSYGAAGDHLLCLCFGSRPAPPGTAFAEKTIGCGTGGSH